MTDFEDILYSVDGPAAMITINRPERYNAFRGRTIDELIQAFLSGWADPAVRCIILTGSGDRAFCSGGDVKQRAETGDYGATETGIFQIDRLHRLIREVPKPVIAAVNGVALGGGHVLQVLCDLSIASDHATFGQAGPRVGSFDAGFGTTYLARVLGEKRAREVWYLCRRYSAQRAMEWGLVNEVVTAEHLIEEAKSWAAEIAALSPTALAFLKRSFNADTEHQAGIQGLAMLGLKTFGLSAEASEGAVAFVERRSPDFSQFAAPV